MRLGLRLLFGFFLVTGLAGFFVLRIFVAEVKPSVREVMEDMMVDTANILAELASDDLAQGQMGAGRFAGHVRNYARRPIDASIWGLSKQTLDFRIYVTDARGTVLFDSENTAVGQDYSQWRDVARTLRGEYGARATRQVQSDDKSSVMYVAAPVNHDGRVIGVLTVAKPVATIQGFIDRAERKILLNGLLLLAISAAIGVAVTLWVVSGVRRLRRYANAVAHDAPGARPAVPAIPGELGDLARAMDAMRDRLERHEYIEDYVRALTHELKSPLAAIRGAGELLQDELPAAERREFSAQVLDQSMRLQSLVERMLELSKLEHRQASIQKSAVALEPFLQRFAAPASPRHPVRLQLDGAPVTLMAEPTLLELALNNLLDNARAFAPEGTAIRIEAAPGLLAVQDAGPGVTDPALARLGERFYSTVRPDGQTRGSGLGLAIVRQIMTLHGGHMTARNMQPGLRVELHFPA